MRSKRLRNRGQTFTRASDSTGKKKRPWGKYLYLASLCLIALKLLGWLYRSIFLFEGTGFLEAETFFVAATSAGTITAITCSVNDTVAAGQVLVFLDTALRGQPGSDSPRSGAYYTTERRIIDLRGRIDLLQQKVNRHNTQVRELEDEYARAQRLLAINSITRAQFTNLARQVQNARFDLEAARTELATALRALRSYEKQKMILAGGSSQAPLMPMLTLSAVTEGVVAAVYKQKGEGVTTGESILKIVNRERNYIKAYFPGSAENSIREGDEARIDFANGDQTRGLIRKIYPTTNPQPAELRHRFGKVQRYIIVEIVPKKAPAWDRILETQAAVFVRRQWF